MKIRFIPLGVLLVFSLVFGNQLDSLTVQKAVAFAIEHNPSLNQLRQQIKMAEAARWETPGIGTPVLSWYKEGIPLSQSTTSPPFQEKGLRLSQSIDFPLTSLFRYQTANARVHALRLQYEARVRELRAQVKSDYARVAYYLELSHLSQQMVEIARAFKNTVKARLDAGEASELELLNAEIRSQEANNQLLDARWQYDKARYQLFNTIGLDPDNQTYHIVFLDSLRYTEVLIPQEEVLAELPQLPEIQSARLSYQGAQSGVKAAWSSFLPNINLLYYRQDYGRGIDFYGWEVGLSLPLDFLFRQKPRIQQAKADARFMFWEYEKQLLNWKKRAEYVWHQYATAMQKLQPYHAEIRAKSRKLLQLTLQGYQMGEIDYLSLLEAQRVYLQTEQHYFTTLFDYSMSVIQMEIFLGKELIFISQE